MEIISISILTEVQSYFTLHFSHPSFYIHTISTLNNKVALIQTQNTNISHLHASSCHPTTIYLVFYPVSCLGLVSLATCLSINELSGLRVMVLSQATALAFYRSNVELTSVISISCELLQDVLLRARLQYNIFKHSHLVQAQVSSDDLELIASFLRNQFELSILAGPWVAIRLKCRKELNGQDVRMYEIY